MRFTSRYSVRPTRARASGPLYEALESRALFNAAPVGSEFVVNALKSGDQLEPSVAADASGAFVVAWQSGDSYGGEIRARLFGADGQPRSEEFRVDSPGGVASTPSVAMDDSGDFVIAWVEYDARGGGGNTVHFQRYDAVRGAQGPVTVAGPGYSPSVAMDADGDFVLVHRGLGQHSTFTIQRYNPSGEPDGKWVHGESQPFSNGLGIATVAMRDAGDFTLAFTESNSSNSNAYFQRYANGAFGNITGVFPESELVPAAALAKVSENDRGDTVVVVTTSAGVYARAFDASGSPRGGRIYVAEGVHDLFYGAALVADDGSFVVTYARFVPFMFGPAKALARCFDAGGKATGDEILVSDHAAASSVAPAPGGGFVVAMAGPSSTPIPEGKDVYARRYAAAAPPAAIDRVYVRGTQWSEDYLTFLERTGVGSARFGYAAGGTPDPQPLPWVNLDQVSIAFTRDVSVDIDDLHAAGVVRPDYEQRGFEYDNDRHVATWTFDRTTPADRFTFTLDARDVKYAFDLNVVPGDADRNGRTNALDFGAVRIRLGTSAAAPFALTEGAYVRTVDLNGDGRINALDLGGIKARLNQALPPPETATALLHD